MKKKLLLPIFISGLFFVAISVNAATLSLSPSSGNYSLGQTFSVNIFLDTKGQAVDGVDIYHLNYNPVHLEVIDDNVSQSGVQVAPGALMPMTLANTVNANNGKITFSQITAGGITFTSSGAETLAIIRFKVLQAVDTQVYFDFVQNGTSDTNVASKGKDILTAVTNGNYGPSSQPSAPTPPALCIESWTCAAWSSCKNGAQTRTCVDAKKCGTANKRPGLSQSCVSALTAPAIPTPEPAPSSLPISLPAPSATASSAFLESTTRYFAADYCKGLGYKYSFQEDSENRYGFCSFFGLGGCDAWDYYCKCGSGGLVADCKNNGDYGCSLPCKGAIYSISERGFGAILAITIIIFIIRYFYAKRKKAEVIKPFM